MDGRRHDTGITWSRSLFTWSGVLIIVLLAGLIFAACDDDEDDGDGEPTATEEMADGTEEPSDGTSRLDELIEQGSVSIAISGEAPYGFEDENGNATGEAVEVAKAVFERLGIPDVQAEVVDFGSLIPGVQAMQFDMIAAGMFITPDRAEDILFSDPDYCAVQGFAVAEGNPLGVEPSFDSLAETGARVGLLSGAVEIGYSEEAGVTEDNMEIFDQVPNLFEALQDGRIDVVALTSITVGYQATLLDGIEATESFVYVDPEGNEIFGCGGFGFNREHQEFRDAFNEILVEMRENDEILPLVEQFGFTSAELNQAKGVTVEDLVGGE